MLRKKEYYTKVRNPQREGEEKRERLIASNDRGGESMKYFSRPLLEGLGQNLRLWDLDSK